MATPVARDVQQPGTQDPVNQTPKSRILTWAALILVIIGGALPRLNHIDKSIWTPEAWVSNSVLADDVGQMIRYKDWLQTSPPLFLFLVRGTVRTAGVSVGSLRAVPFGLSILSLILIAWLAKQLLRTPFAVICTALVALSPPAVVFSKEVKQFTGDMAASCLVLLLCWSYLRRPDGRRYLLLCAAVSIALFLSYPAVTFIPVVFTVLVANNGNPHSTRESLLWRVGILATITAAICFVNYRFFIKPNTSTLLTDYWSDGYPRFDNLRAIVSFYARYFLGMGVYFYLPIGSKDFLSSALSSSGMGIVLLLLFAAIGISVLAFAALRRNQRHLAALAICFGPLLCLAVINALRLYPVSSRRLTLFMLPCISLVAAIIMQSAWDIVCRRMKAAMADRSSAVITIVCILVVLFAATHSDQWGNYWFEDEDTGGALRYVRSHAAPEDTIYVHASIEEPAKLYFRILQWNPRDLRYGNTGRPCCTRTPEPTLLEPTSQRQYVLRDFEQVMSEKRVGRLWLISTGRNGHWGYLGRNELEIIEQYLTSSGCRKDSEQYFAYETVQEFSCADSRLRVAN